MNEQRSVGEALALVLGLAVSAGPAKAVGPRVSFPQVDSATVGASALEGHERLRVFLMTVGQGSAIWEHFGHNALVIEDTVEGTRVAWHWGLFDFDEPGFIPKFLRGEMEYWMGGFDASRLSAAYERLNREVVLQELALTPDQARDLQTFVRWNARPENRYYRYDYFVDNCSTRLRDVLDRVMGGALQRQFSAQTAGVSYRHETDRLTGRALPDYLGITLLLGPRGDLVRTKWEQMFTPLNLRIWIREVEVDGPSGREPFVRSEAVVAPSTRPQALAGPPPLLIPLLLTGAGFGALFGMLGRLAQGPGRIHRLPLAVAGGLWSLVAGTGGVILVLVHWTDHVWMYGNENVLQLSPFSLLLAAAVPVAVLGGGTLKRTRLLAGGVAALAVVGLLAQALPGVDQVNGVIIALALPPHLGLALAVSRLGKSREAEASRLNT